MYKPIILIISILILSACSSVPKPIRYAPDPDIQLSEVRYNFADYQGKAVRWGGTLVSVKNTDAESRLQILSYPLNYNGRPDLSADPQGRFLVKSNEFLDPEFYTKDSEITVAGVLTDQSLQTVDKKSLNLPVIEDAQIYRWRKYRPVPYPYYGGYYGGYYGSFGYCPTPFYGGFGFGYRGFYRPYRYW